MSDHTTIPEKRCTQCGEKYPATAEYFHRDKSRRDGLCTRCKACACANTHAWYIENTERAQAWKVASIERVRGYRRTWLEAKPERVRERRRVYEQNRRARKRSLPNTFTLEQQRFAVEFWNECCAYCGRQFHDLFNERTLAFDHYIPLSSPDCPGTTAGNMLPVCHGVDGCNTTKNMLDPEEWLAARFGKRKARQKAAAIKAYFDIISKRYGDTEQE